MFCRNCGSDVTDMKYCPKCGTPTAIENENVTTGEKLKGSKVKRKYVLLMLGVGIALLGIAVIVLLQKLTSEPVSNSVENQTSVETSRTNAIATKLPNYVFAVDGYVEIQSDDIQNVKIIDYLPNRDMTLTYKDRNDLSTIYYVAPVPNEPKVEYRMTEELVNFDTYLGGEYTYNESTDAIVESIHDGGMNIYLIPIGKASPNIDDISYQVPPYLFTVKIDSKIYEDCVCLLKEDTSTEKRITIATYYAKGIGNVLVTTNFFSDDTNTFEVSDKLVSVENGILIDDLYIEDNADYLPNMAEENISESADYISSEPLYYECFETSGGWDSEIAIYYSMTDEAIDVNIIRIAGGRLELENGDQNPIIYSGYWEDFDSQVSITIPDDSPEITFTATGELEQYNGTYIQLPDSDTDGEN